jgi:hypothetical protein
MEALEGVAAALRKGSLSVVGVALNGDRALEQIHVDKIGKFSAVLAHA